MATKEEHPIVNIELSEQTQKKPSHVEFKNTVEIIPNDTKHETGDTKQKKYKYNLSNHNKLNSESSESPTESDHFNSYDVTKGTKSENNHSEKSPLLSESLNYSARFDTSITSVSFQVSLLRLKSVCVLMFVFRFQRKREMSFPQTQISSRM